MVCFNARMYHIIPCSHHFFFLRAYVVWAVELAVADNAISLSLDGNVVSEIDVDGGVDDDVLSVWC